jgi:hypothetical protein
MIRARAALGLFVMSSLLWIHASGRRFVEHRAQEPVVGAHETIVARFHRDAVARRAHAGIDNGEEDGAGRKVSVRGGKLPCTRTDVVGRDQVGDIDEGGLGTDPEDHALHRADVVVFDAEIGDERDDRA